MYIYFRFESQLRDYIKYLEAKSSNKLTTTRHIKPVTSKCLFHYIIISI